MGVDDILLETEEKMEGAVAHLAGELRGMRTGRASPALVDNLRVDYYGAMTPLSQMAQIGCPEPRLIVIKPFDASAIPNIDKAIQTSNLGLNPQNDGKVIRLILPPLSEERRKQLVKVVKEQGETANVAIRNVRRDGNKAADTAFNDRAITEDQLDEVKEQIQTLTKTYEGKVKELVDKKSAELME
ncbi:MAG: ribosome recycling factor [Planctomycetia bacterium]|jgi:ribosome recycling factor|nr:ribosome recycling factor [Planctomycetia bacterium]